jgi:hypothetical protein
VQTLKEAGTAQHEMSMSGGTRAWWLFSDAVRETAAAALVTLCEGVTMAGDAPIVANFM